ncbi:XkdF-like putative serine protease domain-containing protein [Methanosphaera sp. ISO3-F5]|uniref:XkdF-like putative serine protease domain-containing protein n=1 Tax=Methanosphaera sp. ISO3-F5 TaxID=1452353 RepID=UPI002B25D975|nr:XkdF-like putative serine protease domain-containing protein [Methanosphaera sp. ISO3-F5]WQH64096.1 XkdF-like putative serine protease domain-containing protein [Methanosphaera sp. ISO3-F5]
MTIRVGGPILVPDTPDCDYKNGEEILSAEKIDQLKQTFKAYNIVDYQHQFTNQKNNYFLENIGEPVRLVTLDKELTFKDVTGTDITVPPGTLWLDTDIHDETVCKEVENKEIVAYSVTVSEKEDADEVINIYKNVSSKQSRKQDYTKEMERINEKISSKRTLIRDIQNPVLLTVSVVKFPCVNKAKFCQQSIKKVGGATKMSNNENNDNANNKFLNSLKNAVNEFRGETQQDNTPTEDADIEAMMDEKVEKMRDELKKDMQTNQEEVLNAIKSLRTAPRLSDEDTLLVDDGTGDDGVTPAINQDPDEGTTGEGATGEDEDEKPEKDTTPEDKKEDNTDDEGDEPPKTKTRKGKGGKSKKNKDDTIIYAQPSAQQSRKSGKLEEDKKVTIKRNEDDVIYDAIKNGMSTKGINIEDIDLTGTGLHSTYENDVFLSLLNNKYAAEVYKASFGEDDSNKAILSTNVFSTFVTKLIQEEPIFLDCGYQTGHHGKGYIYNLDNGTYDTEDGHLPENFYFDSDPADDEFDIDVREIKCYTQRRRVTISDRQRLSNVYGDDLVNKVLEISRKKLFRGVYAARVWSDTTLANSVDKQYRRQDGLVKQAGVQLTGSDVNFDNPVDVFSSMFYALPEEARTPSDYTFYVPTNLYLGYYNYITNAKKETKYEWVSQEQTLFWNNIPIKVSPTLNRADMKTLVYGGDSAALLINPQETQLIVGREAGIEPKRNADTSSDTFYETIDTAVVYNQPDYNVALKIGADDYEGLVGKSGDDQP